MNIWASERPGVYSDYDASGILWGSGTGKAVGIAATGGAQPGRVYAITRASDAGTLFGGDSPLSALCAIALANGAARVAAVPVDGTDPGYTAAFAALEQEALCAVLCDSTAQAVHTALKSSVERASSRKKERVGLAVYEGESPYSWAEAFQSERMVLLAQTPESGPACGPAAALAGRIAEAAGPNHSLHGAAFIGIEPVRPALTEQEIDQLVQAGVSPMENAAGSVALIRAVTSRVTDGEGNPDRTFQELSTVLTLDHVIAAVRDSLESLLRGARNNGRTRAALATQAGVVLQAKRAAGLIDSFERPAAYPDESDPAACVVEIAFVIAGGLNQIRVAAHIQV